MRPLKKVLRVLKFGALALAGMAALLALGNSLLTAIEKRSDPAPGQLVSVDGTRMHVMTEGIGQENVVLLPGLGTPGPVVDFAPLVRELRADFRVTVVEPFGYGWSDGTSRPRTNANVVEEMRRALRQAGVLPPYLLVPHSMSGIYALYYANRYPREVRGLAGLDTTLPDQLAYLSPPRTALALTAARSLGVVRLALALRPDLGGYEQAPYTPSQRERMRRFACWNYGNSTVDGEVRAVRANLQEVQGFTVPKGIPARFILARDTIKEVSTAMPGLDWVQAHRALVTEAGAQAVLLVDGGHSVHWRNSPAIASVVRELARGSK